MGRGQSILAAGTVMHGGKDKLVRVTPGDPSPKPARNIRLIPVNGREGQSLRGILG
jgi:hypothetical protein